MKRPKEPYHELLVQEMKSGGHKGMKQTINDELDAVLKDIETAQGELAEQLRLLEQAIDATFNQLRERLTR